MRHKQVSLRYYHTRTLLMAESPQGKETSTPQEVVHTMPGSALTQTHSFP